MILLVFFLSQNLTSNNLDLHDSASRKIIANKDILEKFDLELAKKIIGKLIKKEEIVKSENSKFDEMLKENFNFIREIQQQIYDLQKKQKDIKYKQKFNSDKIIKIKLGIQKSNALIKALRELERVADRSWVVNNSLLEQKTRLVEGSAKQLWQVLLGIYESAEKVDSLIANIDEEDPEEQQEEDPEEQPEEDPEEEQE